MAPFADTPSCFFCWTFCAPIVVSGGYRSPNLNKAIAKSDIAFDQLTVEYGRWVHLGLAPASVEPQRQLLSIGSTHTHVSGLKVV